MTIDSEYVVPLFDQVKIYQLIFYLFIPLSFIDSLMNGFKCSVSLLSLILIAIFHFNLLQNTSLPLFVEPSPHIHRSCSYLTKQSCTNIPMHVYWYVGSTLPLSVLVSLWLITYLRQ